MARGPGDAADLRPFNGAGPCGPELGDACRQNLITHILQWGLIGMSNGS